MRYNASGSMIASGGKDTDIVLWDVVGETGLFRLRGHKDQVTDLVRTAQLYLHDAMWNLQVFSGACSVGEHRLRVMGGHPPFTWRMVASATSGASDYFTRDATPTTLGMSSPSLHQVRPPWVAYLSPMLWQLSQDCVSCS